jgi:hypothetical protein
MGDEKLRKTSMGVRASRFPPLNMLVSRPIIHITAAHSTLTASRVLSGIRLLRDSQFNTIPVPRRFVGGARGLTPLRWVRYLPVRT